MECSVFTEEAFGGSPAPVPESPAIQGLGTVVFQATVLSCAFASQSACLRHPAASFVSVLL